MANAKVSAVLAAKQSFLPPRSPLPSLTGTSGAPLYTSDLGPVGSRSNGSMPLHGQQHHHQRTSSESFIIDEQPSWLEDLLDEPETPEGMRRGGHRRSSSDSFTLFEPKLGFDLMPHEEFVPRTMNSSVNQWGQLDRAYQQQGSLGWDAAPLNLMGYGHRTSNRGGLPMNDRVGHHETIGSSRGYCMPTSDGLDWRNIESTLQEKAESERKDIIHVKHPSQSEADTKRAKQQYAQRSRVRKLQYIAELERKVQALQAEGAGVSAEMDFLGQQNIMLDLENKALKQRLESLAQEQLIKRFQQEMFEREVSRLRSLYQQQQQQQQQIQQAPGPAHNRSNSRDLDLQFANLSLKHKDPNSVPGPLRI